MNKATCHPDKKLKARGLCSSCYDQLWKTERYDRQLPLLTEEYRNTNPEYVYANLPIDNSIPDLKRDDYFINQGDARKLPRLLTV